MTYWNSDFVLNQIPVENLCINVQRWLTQYDRAINSFLFSPDRQAVVMEKYVGHIHVQRQLELSEQTDTTMHMKYLMII